MALMDHVQALKTLPLMTALEHVFQLNHWKYLHSPISSNNIDTTVKGTSHEVLIHAMDNVATNTETYMNTSAIIGYKIVGDNIDKEVKPRFACSNYPTKSLHYFHSFALQSWIDCSHFLKFLLALLHFH